MSVLTVKGLNVSFRTEGGNLSALNHVGFEVPENRIVGLVGESGCGKSTLINAILGLLADNGQIDRGEIIFKGQDLLKLDKKQLQAMRGPRIATVFQDPMGALNPVITVGKQMEHIQYRSTLSREQKQAHSVEMLKRVHIPDAEAALMRYPHEFSGGMKQRIAIAMALMMEPDLLIADEPTTALDATLEVVTIELLKNLQKEIGCAILFISHHLGVIAELCDEVIVMYAGEVVEYGPTLELFSAPKHPYTQRLLDCDPGNQTERTRHLPTIPGEIPDLKARPAGCIFASRCDQVAEACSDSPAEKNINGHRVRCVRVEA